MISIECDNCEKTFEADPKDAGGKVPCPLCGDVNRVPAAHTPEADGLPPDAGPETDILAFRPAMLRAKPLAALIILLLFFGGLVGAFWVGREGNRALLYMALGASVIALLWWAGWYINHLTQQLRLTNKRTIYRRGLLRKHTNEVLHDHIRNMQIEQSLFQRLVGTGNITLDSSAGGGSTAAEITVRDVPKPAKLKKIIDQYRNL
ncbi:MAG: PH domain-containing protein [Planctomycetota bacterium]